MCVVLECLIENEFVALSGFAVVPAPTRVHKRDILKRFVFLCG
jgi:hypothetical protein